MEVTAKRGDPMKDNKIPSHQIDVVEIMKKIRQSAASSRTELTIEEKVRREAKSELITLAQAARIPDATVDEIRQQTVFEPYDPRTLYSSSRPGVGSLIGLIRKILKPITKLFINLDPLAHEVNRLSLLNNFYLKSIQDLIVKNAALRVEMHHMKRRTGHQHGRDHSSRSNNQNYRRSRHPRREHSGEMRNRHGRPGSRTPVAEEPQA
jgi:hypothetical protein